MFTPYPPSLPPQAHAVTLQQLETLQIFSLHQRQRFVALDLRAREVTQNNYRLLCVSRKLMEHNLRQVVRPPRSSSPHSLVLGRKALLLSEQRWL